MRRKLKPTIKATSEPRLQRDEPILFKNHATTPTRRTSNQLLHTIHSHLTFTAPIHSTYSQHLFTPDVHTGTTDRDDNSTARDDSSTARRRTQPEKCGGNHQRANHQRAYGPTGLRTNGSADAHRVLGAEHGSRSMSMSRLDAPPGKGGKPELPVYRSKSHKASRRFGRARFG